MAEVSHGEYCGHNSILEERSKDTFEVIVDDEIQEVSRWAMNIVDQGLRNHKVCMETDRAAQFARTHCGSKITSRELSTTPAKDLVIDRKTHKPVIGVRVFHGGPSAVVNNVAYFNYYGYVRCNLSQDTHLAEGVYAYIDIQTALRDIDLNLPFDRTKVPWTCRGRFKA